MKPCKYEYDASCGVLIKCCIPPKIIKQNHLVWKDLGPEDDSYARAIFLGQGCWERLDTLTEAQALKVLEEWGYTSDSQTSADF